MTWMALIGAFLAGGAIVIACVEYDSGGMDVARKWILWAIFDVVQAIAFTLAR